MYHVPEMTVATRSSGWVWACILTPAGIVNWIVYIPSFEASPFSVRVWIPFTPDVPAPALTLVSALISDGDNRNCPSCAWTKEIAAAIIKAVVNRIFIMSPSTYCDRESHGTHHLKRGDYCQSGVSRRLTRPTRHPLDSPRRCPIPRLAIGWEGYETSESDIGTRIPVRFTVAITWRRTRNEQTERPWRQLHTTWHRDDIKPNRLWRHATCRSGSVGTTARR